MSKSRTSATSSAPIDPARQAAITAFLAILEGSSMSAALPLAIADLEPRDAGFVHALIHAASKSYWRNHALLKRMMDRPQRKRLVQSILHLSLTELFDLATPDHAVINSYVEIAKSKQGLAPYKGLINALLRRAQREAETVRTMSPTSHLPQWMAESWKAAYGEEAVNASLAMMLEEPSLDLALKTDSPDLAQTLLASREGVQLAPTSLRLSSAQGVATLPGFETGDFWVQDFSAQLPATLFGDVTDKTIADFCAAPGGKTMQLAAKGAHVTAYDISEERLERLKDNLARTRLAAKTEARDLAENPPSELFDCVLLDAPCSATGTLRRNPDVLIHRRQADIPALQQLQRQLIRSAISCLKPGGTLVYSVCSMEPEEGEHQMKWVLKKFPELSLKALSAKDFPLFPETAVHSGALRLLPHFLPHDTPRLSGMDGFFAAVFVKQG